MKRTNIRAKANLLALTFMASGLTLYTQVAYGQGIKEGLESAKTGLTGVFSALQIVLYAVAAIVGLYGGFRCYSKWQHGDKEIGKDIAGWAGACIFIVVMGTVLKTIFNPL
jgi:hypothetical protein